jgi:hypothetical protein
MCGQTKRAKLKGAFLELSVANAPTNLKLISFQIHLVQNNQTNWKQNI